MPKTTTDLDTGVTEPDRKSVRLANSDDPFLKALGSHVRELRERRGMTRKALALEADVSERYLAQLESGEGNVSIVLLRRITTALNVAISEVLDPETVESVETRLIRRFLERVPAHRLEELLFRLMRELGEDEAIRRKRIALIGLRGAGKTTLGKRLASQLGVPFVELNAEVERETGLPLSEIFSLYGQLGFRRLERMCLDRLIRDNPRAVISVGGGIVAEQDTFDLLLNNCQTVWLKATPAEHMARVLAQGDLRPMAGNNEAMDDLQRILNAREALYRKADVTIDTSGDSLETSLARLREAIAV